MVTEDSSDVSGNMLREKVLDELVQETDISLLPRFLELFFKDIPERLARVDDAVTNQDWDVLQREAHTIGSSSATFGAIIMHDQARLIEGMCLEKQYEAAVLEVPKLHGLMDQTFAALQAYQTKMDA